MSLDPAGHRRLAWSSRCSPARSRWRPWPRPAPPTSWPASPRFQPWCRC